MPFPNSYRELCCWLLTARTHATSITFRHQPDARTELRHADITPVWVRAATPSCQRWLTKPLVASQGSHCCVPQQQVFSFIECAATSDTRLRSRRGLAVRAAKQNGDTAQRPIANLVRVWTSLLTYAIRIDLVPTGLRYRKTAKLCRDQT